MLTCIDWILFLGLFKDKKYHEFVLLPLMLIQAIYNLFTQRFLPPSSYVKILAPCGKGKR